NFIAFLYFYSTLKGSLESSGTIDNGIVVIDYPVSSMDNDALFIISILIRELFEDVCNERGTLHSSLYCRTTLIFTKKFLLHMDCRGHCVIK
ncbi:MAG: AAA family ATPase, partial [Dialister invisus]